MTKTTQPMRKVYIGHPLRGPAPAEKARIIANILSVSRICLRLIHDEPDILILSPIHAFFFYDPEGDQTAVLSKCRALLALADEARFYGDWRASEGCRMEIDHARALGIPVLFPEDPHGGD